VGRDVGAGAEAGGRDGTAAGGDGGRDRERGLRVLIRAATGGGFGLVRGGGGAEDNWVEGL